MNVQMNVKNRTNITIFESWNLRTLFNCLLLNTHGCGACSFDLAD